MRDSAVGAARSLGIAVLAGAIAGGAVGGVGGRLLMRLIAVQSGPGAQGASTENGNIVGQITPDGTVALIFFSGIALGVIGGLVYGATDPWLRRTGRWRPLAFGAFLVVVLGFTVIDATNSDFRSFGHPTTNVLLFSAIFVAYGAFTTWLAERLDRVTPGGHGVSRRGLVGIAVALLVAGSLAIGILLLGAVIATTAQQLSGAPAEAGFGLTNGLMLLGILAAGLLARTLAGPWRSVALAIPSLAGALLTARSIAGVLGVGA